MSRTRRRKGKGEDDNDADFDLRDEDDDYHPSADHTPRHPTDDRLREFGFKIHARQANAIPLWTRDGEVMDEEDALAIVAEESRKKLEV